MLGEFKTDENEDVRDRLTMVSTFQNSFSEFLSTESVLRKTFHQLNNRNVVKRYNPLNPSSVIKIKFGATLTGLRVRQDCCNFSFMLMWKKRDILM